MSGQPTFGVLGPVVAWDNNGEPLALRGPRHRAVLARLIVARGQVVPVGRLVDDLWIDPPAGAVSALRTFVAALRRALEPDRSPRAQPTLLVTEGPGYALRLAPDAVDAWRFERAAAVTRPASTVAAGRTGRQVGARVERLEEALGWWRGPAFADFADYAWARGERSRLAELRLQVLEQLASARLELGQTAEVVAELDALVTEHPWREEAWRLLALALYRSDRQGDALAVLRRARSLLVEQLGIDPGPALRQLEIDVLQQAEHLTRDADRHPQPEHLTRMRGGPPQTEHLPRKPGGQAEAEDGAAQRGESADTGSSGGDVWDRAVAAYGRGVGERARLESTVGLLRSLAVTGGGGLEAAREHRLAAVAAAEELGDVELAARVIGAYDVPAIWTRVDDEAQAAGIVAAAERTLIRLPAAAEWLVGTRARLLATIALESRGSGSARAAAAAREAVETARKLDDPAVLAFALNGLFMQTFRRAGLAPERDAIGAELIELAVRHGLQSFEVLGHLIRIQSRSALGDFAGADAHAGAVDQLAARHELPLVGVFTTWYAALRRAAGPPPAGRAASHAATSAAEQEATYRDAARSLDGAGMPGLQRGLLPLALLTIRLRRDLPLSSQPADYGPYEPWVRPLLLLDEGRTDDAAAALAVVPEPPRDLMLEAMWTLVAEAAIRLGDRAAMDRARQALEPAATELAGAGSGLITLGPVAEVLSRLQNPPVPKARRRTD
ncbi:transcriptional regulator, SARP family [Kribbella flavida DSM 17836]|uniref:Transcriptional regulator, SARP family n=1 Tax=Kribbella flavida (strain DSM 17836 / JCM 10339 / NBRC 14399) TaxID=479435 RepID=D2PX08_KRIFD|nr:BTAD domain-containing putative transcriptional regulator [Kribbella flavida]ADB35388.1 transcriptional regulator, SARP family [Kribbella flavida DSM 17836]